jgi:HJR/Mrr/RecB family endonuclease
MSDRLRIVLMAAALFALGYAGLGILLPASLNEPAKLAIVFLFACIAAAIMNRRRRDDRLETDEGQYRVSDKPAGRDYEEACKEILKSLGWQIVPTPKSRDRGADIFAIKGSTKLIVQCKDYKRVVSYKAVSEVIAAARFYPADHLCVVAPCEFTNDAKRGAREGGVKLLHHDELRRWARTLA